MQEIMYKLQVFFGKKKIHMVADEIVLGLGTVHLYLSERLFQWVSVQKNIILDRLLAFARDRWIELDNEMSLEQLERLMVKSKVL